MIESLKISTKSTQKPMGGVLYALSGLGKTTFLGDYIRDAENGLLFQCGEDGLSDLDTSWSDGIPHYEDVLGDGSTPDELADGWIQFRELLKFLMIGEHDLTHIAFDSFDNIINNNLDAFVVREYYGGNNKEANGWGGAKTKEMYAELALIIKAFEYLQKKRGMSVLLSMHSQAVNFRDPATPDYKKWSLAIPSREDFNLRSLIINWASVVMFGTLDVDVDNKKGSGNKRVLKTQVDASWDAKSRYVLPANLNFKYEDFKKAIVTSLKGSK